MKSYQQHRTVEVAAHRHEYELPLDSFSHYECRVCKQRAPIGLVKGFCADQIITGTARDVRPARNDRDIADRMSARFYVMDSTGNKFFDLNSNGDRLRFSFTHRHVAVRNAKRVGGVVYDNLHRTFVAESIAR